jgi:hypothetical protein
VPQVTPERSFISGRNARPLTGFDPKFYGDLQRIGIELPQRELRRMAQFAAEFDGFGMDALQPLVSVASIPTPIQFLQNWLPGFVEIATAARKIDEIVGISTAGAWEDEEVVQGVIELTGTSVPYGDYTNIPLSSWNTNFEEWSVVRFEEGMQVGVLEEARASRLKINSSASKRESSTRALEIQRNAVGFFGYNSGNNMTYGFLNDPGLPAYVEVPTGVSGETQWSTKTYLEIIADLRTAFSTLRTSSAEVVDPTNQPTTLALATAVIDYLSVVSDYGNSVMQWLKETYPKCRVESAPELDAANSGDNVFYLFADEVKDSSTDDGRVFTQVVPAKFRVIGVEQKAKGYIEDYSNATAGVRCKRPFAVVRYYGV